MAKRIVSPRAKAVYPHLFKPDTGFGQNKFKIQFLIPKAEATDYVKVLKETARAEFGAKAKDAKLPFIVDEETGELKFTAKSDYKPLVVDSKGRKIGKVFVGNGSIVKVDAAPFAYSTQGNGVSLRLSGVQIIRLVEGDGGSMFTEEEDEEAFEYDGEPPADDDGDTGGGNDEGGSSKDDWDF
jgi:hypothetical protein